MKKISLKDIKSGALLGKPEKVTVKFKLDGEEAEFETHVKPFNYDTAIANYKAYGENKAALAGIIASCLCDADGKLILTEDDVRQHFNQALVDATWNEIIQVNAAGKAITELDHDTEICIEIGLAIGRTYREVQQTLSYREVQTYAAYIAKRGSLNTGRRIEQAMGKMFANYLRSKGAKRVDEFVFMPHEDKPVISLEDQLMSMTKS